MELNRKPTIKEEQLLELLVDRATIKFSNRWKENLLVRPMIDGEMGSLYLFPNGQVTENRSMGSQISEFQFTDSDGVEVIASLNVDNNHNLFELDIWKTDFSPLIDYPDYKNMGKIM